MQFGLQYQRLRAPRTDRSVLVQPDWKLIPSILRQNRSQLDANSYQLHDISVTHWARQARRYLIREAQQYTAGYQDVDEIDVSSELPALILAGHQPQLFHPGVWIKNFALDRLARLSNGVGIQLVIDNDLCRWPGVRVPAGSAEHVYHELVVMDRVGSQVAFEQRTIQDRQQFDSFGQRLREAVCSLIPEPMIDEFWPLAIDASQRTRNMGQCLAQARHTWERERGLSTLEVPLSRVCEGETFRNFVTHIVHRLPDFHSAYNGSLADYRQVNRLRSRTHPVPNLTQRAGYLEIPFWLWSERDPQRRPVFAKLSGNKAELWDGANTRIHIDFSSKDTRRAAQSIYEARQTGFKLRPRALITTMFARMFLGDLFIHGIGGAKYDQLTDEIIRRFFEVEPPNYLTISATIYLPVDKHQVSPHDITQIDQQIRELTYHPEAHLDGLANNHPEVQLWTKAKADAIGLASSREERKSRHDQIVEANMALQPFVDVKRGQLLAQREQLRRLLGQEAILSSREYPFCIYPEKILWEALDELTKPTTS